jgi:hypothetical protein
VHIELSWSVVSSRALPPAPVIDFTHVNRILRL